MFHTKCSELSEKLLEFPLSMQTCISGGLQAGGKCYLPKTGTPAAFRPDKVLPQVHTKLGSRSSAGHCLGQRSLGGYRQNGFRSTLRSSPKKLLGLATKFYSEKAIGKKKTTTLYAQFLTELILNTFFSLPQEAFYKL